MPRHPDPDLESRILNAAHRLWKQGGEKALTMRAVAEAAGTNTPAVYRRFKDRRDIVRALLRRIQESLRERIEPCKSVEEISEAYIDYAVLHPHEYELFDAYGRELFPRKKAGRARSAAEVDLAQFRPNMKLLLGRLAERLGGVPEEHLELALALWAASHGTAMLILHRALPEKHDAEFRRALKVTVAALMGAATDARARK
jgi:AcrR family transcriptional regulator